MRILLTGSNGFVGNILYKELINDAEVVTIGRSNSNYNLDLAINIPNFEHAFDLVIHAAGKAHTVAKSSVEEQVFFDINLNGTRNLLKGLEQSESLPRAFLFISTVAVYGIDRGCKISEDAPLLAKEPYGLSKMLAEQVVIQWCRKNSVICTILRLPLVAGSNPPGNLGAMIKGVKRGYYFNIAGGKARKSMVLATDVAQCLLSVSEIGGIYNLTDGYHPTFLELSRIIGNQLGRKNIPNLPLFFAKVFAVIGDLGGEKSPINSNLLIKITESVTFDDTKARNVFGWNPTSVLDGFKIGDYG